MNISQVFGQSIAAETFIPQIIKAVSLALKNSLLKPFAFSFSQIVRRSRNF
jgi:hypothetical protein